MTTATYQIAGRSPFPIITDFLAYAIERQTMIETEKVYAAEGNVVRKLPVTTKNDDGSTSLSIGFPVCTLTYWGDDQGETVAMLLNRGAALPAVESLAADMLEALRAADDLSKLGIMNAPDGLYERVTDLRRDAIAKATAMGVSHRAGQDDEAAA